jgi:predicted dehydrogenase/threonine dehydrogenase-like Zn-dependent dehydrogenase
MKQVLIRGGNVSVDEVPAPGVDPRGILVQVAYSCVSVGTELAQVELSGLPLYRRALKQREQAKRVLEIARSEGFGKTYKRVSGMLAAGVPTGYSASGRVLAVGELVEEFRPGDLVACAGAGIANHAEVISVPVNLAVKVPDGLDLAPASTVTLGAIALQGVRRAEPTLGETVGVIGLGILGQLTVQLLRAAGCRVIGSDVDARRVEQALENGMDTGVVSSRDDFATRAHELTGGFGADAVIVTAATPSHDVMRDAFAASRRKGRVVLVGDVGLNLHRADMYEKELDFRISTSYGPGRYDPVYEDEGADYPIAYVRWTENRNMAEYLRLLATEQVSLERFETETYEIDAATDAYEALRGDGERPLVALLTYPERAESGSRTTPLRTVAPRAGRLKVALVGAGSFAQGTHLPNLLRLSDRFQIHCVMSRTGAIARAIADRAEAAYSTTDLDQVLGDDDVDLVLVSTRHDLHAQIALQALEAGKHVFVEKPLALAEDGLERIEAFYAVHEGPLLMTGFNRRFSPPAVRLRELLAGRSAPILATYRVNAGYIPPDSWVHGPEGGGRNIGEACHMYDLFLFLTGGTPASVSATSIDPSSSWRANDNFVATIGFDDGSVCSLAYTALGHREHPKERLEVFSGGSVAALDDFRSLSVAGAPGGWKSRTQQKGHAEELAALAGAVRDGGPWPISLDDQLAATRISFEVERNLRRERSPGSSDAEHESGHLDRS